MIDENFNCDKKLAHLNEEQPILEVPKKDKKPKKPRNSKIKDLDFYASYVSKNVEIQKNLMRLIGCVNKNSKNSIVY